MRFLCKFEGAIGVFQRSRGLPVFRRFIPFFVVLGSGTVGLCGKFVLLERSSVKLVHVVLL